MQEIDTCNIMTRMFKYSLLGITTAIALTTIPKNKLELNVILMIITAVLITYVIVDSPLFNKESYTCAC